VSGISVDRVGMERLMKTQTRSAENIDKALKVVPKAVDGGTASDLIALLVSAAAETTAALADSFRALAAITLAVLNDFSLTEEQIVNDFNRIAAKVAAK